MKQASISQMRRTLWVKLKKMFGKIELPTVLQPKNNIIFQ